jgi:sugar phosphate isomerase/epimerase
VYIGLLTAPFGRTPIDTIASFASRAGFKGLEIDCSENGQLELSAMLKDNGAAMRKIMDENSLTVTSLILYEGWQGGVEQYMQKIERLIDAADMLGTKTVCTFAGFAEAGKSKMQTIRETLPKIFAPLAQRALAKGIKIAFENWWETNLQHLDHFAAVCEALPQPNIGFNFDPSHLYWQGIDIIAAVEQFGPRIFHTHAKDVAISKHKQQRLGIIDMYNTWQYCIPGFGDIAWGRYIRALKQQKFDGVLSIEHEDGAFGVEEGFTRGYTFLSSLI